MLQVSEETCWLCKHIQLHAYQSHGCSSFLFSSFSLAFHSSFYGNKLLSLELGPGDTVFHLSQLPTQAPETRKDKTKEVRMMRLHGNWLLHSFCDCY